MALTATERVMRYRARKRGENVPRLKGGVPKGYKQRADWVAKRIQRGPDHYRWGGDSVLENAGRLRAQRLYRDIGPCSKCGEWDAERHHADDNTLNNAPDNIRILCRRCHMVDDGRLEQFMEMSGANLERINARRGSSV